MRNDTNDVCGEKTCYIAKQPLKNLIDNMLMQGLNKKRQSEMKGRWMQFNWPNKKTRKLMF